MTLTRTLERLEQFGETDADRALRPPVTDPTGAVPPRRKRAWKRTALITLAALVVVGLLVTWLVAFSPLLGANTVQVEGNAVVSVEEVQAAAGIAHGTPLVRVDAAAVARRVETIPQVASARVDVSYPSTVAITVVERVPVLQLTGPTRLVDATGHDYLEVAAGAAAPEGLPTTTASGAELTVAAEVAGAIPASVRGTLVQRVDVDAHGPGVAPTVELVLTDGRTVVWGDPSRDAEKGALLGTLFGPGAPDVPCGTMDLSSPDQVVCR